MNLKLAFIYFAAISIMSLSACKNDVEQPVSQDAQVTVDFNLKWQGSDFIMQDVYYDNYGNRVRVDKFMNYVSMLTLVKDDGTEVMVRDFSLLDFFNDNKISATVPAAKYTHLKFGLGIPSAYNKDQDPAQYPSSSPLSVAGSQGMFWSWNTGYIFVKFEGKADTSGTEGAELLHPVAIHVGDDLYFLEYTSPTFSLQCNPADSKVLNVNIDVADILGNGEEGSIDLATDAITHTSNNGALARNFVENYLAAITITQ